MRATRRSVLISLGAAPLGAAPLLGCDAGRQPAAPPESAPERPAALRSGVKIAFLTDANQPATPLIETMIAAFTTRQPGIAVEWLRPGGSVNLTAMVAAGTPPDVFSFGQNDIPAMAVSGDALNLDPYIRRDKVDATDFFLAALDMAKYQGKQYGLPRAFNCGVLYTNLSQFDAAGLPRPPEQWGDPRWTWTEFSEAVKRLSVPGAAAADSRYGADLLGGIGFFWAFAYANGGELFNPEMTQARMAEPRTVEALQFLADLIHRFRANPTPADKAALGDRQIFFKGQATMQLIGASNVNLYQANDQFHWDWRPMPAGRAGARNWGGGTLWGMAGKGPSREEAWAFFQHLTSTQSSAALATQYFPSRRTAANTFLDEEARASRPPANRKMVLDAMQNARVRPNHPRYAEVETVINEELGQLWSKGGPAQAAADAIKRRVDPILQAGQAG